MMCRYCLSIKCSFILQSVHWAVKAKKEPMLNAPEDKSPVSTENQASQSNSQGLMEEKPDEHLCSSKENLRMNITHFDTQKTLNKC